MVPFVVVDAEVDAVVADFFKYLINVFLIDGLSVCVVGVAGQGLVVQLNVPQFRGHIGRVMHRDVREFVHIYTLNIQRTLLYTFNWRFMPRVARLVSFMSGFSLRSLTEVMMRGLTRGMDRGFDAGY